MKTLINITSLLSLMAVLFGATLTASNDSFMEEGYIDDIPFNTNSIYNDIITERKLAQFGFEEEAYIDDIPFDTECITAQCLYLKALKVEFKFDEETYVDDIPFDTYQTVVQANYRSALEEVYTFQEERYIDDIPVELFTSLKRNESMSLVFKYSEHE